MIRFLKPPAGVSYYTTGSAAVPPVAGANFTTTGLYWAAGPQLNVTIAGTQRAQFDANGLTLPGLTAGSIPYVGTGGLVTQSNANLLYDNPTTSLRVGTNSGAAAIITGTRLHIYNDAAARTWLQITGLSNQGVGIIMDDTSAAQRNWLVGVNYNAAGVLEITPSTAAGGTTFNANSGLTVDANGNVGIKGSLTSTALTANTAIVSGAAGLIQSVTAVTNSVLVSGAPPTFSANPTVTGLTATGTLQTSSASTPIGYAAGAGGTVTQATSKSTGVTLNTTTGQITTTADALAANTTVSFTLTNSAIAAPDVLILNHVSGGTAGAYTLNAQAAAGSASINLRNVTGGSLSEAIVIGFALIKGRTA